MKTTILLMATLLSMGMLMTSCQKNDLASPSELNKEPEEDESNISYFSIFPKQVAKSTQIEFEILASSYVSLRIFDSNDKVVAHLLGSSMKKGVHNIEFDASKLPEGVYTARLWARHIEFVEELEKIKYTASDREVAY